MKAISAIEQLSLKARSDFQWKEIKKTLDYLNAKSPFYQNLFLKHQIDIGHIQSFLDFEQLPITNKEDLQLHNADFLCVNKKEIVEITSTSGTLGKPVNIALTHNDLERLAYNEYLSFQAMELSSLDTVQLMLSLDKQFMAGMAYYSGLRKIGATIVRSGSGQVDKQWALMEAYQTTTLIAVPSFILKMLQTAPKKLPTSLNKILAIGEPIRDEMGQPTAMAKKIMQELNVQLFGTYASTEMQTAFTECNGGCGGHLNPDLIYVELLDEQNKPIRKGGVGELTITTFGITGMPLLRYKTGDMFAIEEGNCSCGRTSPRLSALLGRKKQMIKFKGTTFYPPALDNLLHQVDGINDYGLSLSKDEWGNDSVQLFINTEAPQEKIKEQVKNICREKLRAVPEINFIDSARMAQFLFPNNDRKPQRIHDFREKTQQ